MPDRAPSAAAPSTRRRAPRSLRRKGAQIKAAAMMRNAAARVPELRTERVELLCDARRELRIDRKGSLAADLAIEIRESRSAQWRRKTATRAVYIRHTSAMVLRDLGQREPRRERLAAGRWQVTALDDAGSRVLAAELLCDVPRSFADPCPVRVMLRRPELFLDGEIMRRAVKHAAASPLP